MKALTSEQEQILKKLIEYAGGNETFQQAMRLAKGQETSLGDFLKLIDQAKAQPEPEPAPPPFAEALVG